MSAIEEMGPAGQREKRERRRGWAGASLGRARGASGLRGWFPEGLLPFFFSFYFLLQIFSKEIF